LDAMMAARQKHALELWAYVIMPDHVHILFFPSNPNYSIRSILQSIKQPVMRRALNSLRKNSPAWLDRLRSAPSGEPHFWQPGGGFDRNELRADTEAVEGHYIHNL